MLRSHLCQPHQTLCLDVNVQTRCELPHLSSLQMQLPTGVSAVTGDEGRGKTRLLRWLAADLTPDSGQMRVHLAGGEQVNWPADSQRYQQEVFFADLRLPESDEDTPEECWASLRTRYPRFNEDLLQAFVQRLKLGEHIHKRLFMLSAGSRRKVGLAGALACGATVTLLDQPFAALDLASTREILEFLQDMSDHPTRAWVVADYEAPNGVDLAACIVL
jgi:ABC-type multidrug transport system ATPase subunit